MAVCIFPTSVFPIKTAKLWVRLFGRSKLTAQLYSIIQVTEDESKLSLTLDVSQFKPEEMKVSVDGRTIIVEGKQKAKDEQSYSMTSFVRHWILPDNVDVEQIHSSLTSEGSLVIEAPKVVKPVKTTRSIPILKAHEENESVKSA
ncbi:Hsp20/alpha crystallin family protein [Oesophagostomum dentatum]|uniref:Hsp20/alpha crystallin family protein n=1 Tax=Oesophagostomum dentatum TaxID=61180 RepID=A0A0B1S3N8_OESDE|nr:Hsp20/alpha crystallin family protein [Oesophagostomum dentatum]